MCGKEKTTNLVLFGVYMCMHNVCKYVLYVYAFI